VSGKLEAQVNRPKNSFLLCFSPKREPLTATDEEKARKYALAYLSKHQIQIPAKNAPSSDPIRIKYDGAFQLAFSDLNFNLLSPRLIIFSRPSRNSL
jgi:hypothetical protein